MYSPRKLSDHLTICNLVQKALRWWVDGVVVGATYPERIKKVYSILGTGVQIYSPGLGA